MSYYSKDLYHDLENISKLPYFNEWYDIVREYLLNDELKRRKLFRHHDGSLWDHLILVSFRSFLLAKYYHVDEKGKMTIKKLYLDPFMDMCNSEILSYGITQRPSSENIMNALNEAIKITDDCPYRRTFHSDQGWAYQMKAYVYTLKKNKIFQSMSRKGNCHDNSIMENFFGIMKQEMYYGKVYYSFDELKQAIDKYIKYYNEKRIKQKLGWLSPVNYRLNLLAA